MARSMNSAEGGTLFFCFLLHRLKAITVQTKRNRAAPVTPIVIAATFNDLSGFVANEPVDVSVGELTLAGERVNEREESVRDRSVGE